MNPIAIRHDTRAWRAQVWISFILASALCATGLAFLPGRDMDRAFMFMACVFSISAAFGLAKFVRDNERRKVDTPLWSIVVWGGFGVAMALSAFGLLQMDVSPTYRAYLAVGWLFLVAQTFTLAKTLRDAHEARIAEARLAERAAVTQP